MTSTHGEPRLGHPDDNLGEFAEELKLLAEAVLERVEPVLRRTAADGRSDWDSCSWCPVCAAAAIVRGEHHDVVAAIADHGTAIVTVLREALAGVPVEPVIPPDLDPDSAEYQAWQQHSHSRLAEDLADAYANARGGAGTSQSDATGRRGAGASGQGAGAASRGDRTAAGRGDHTAAGRGDADAAGRGDHTAAGGRAAAGAGRRDAAAAGRSDETGAGEHGANAAAPRDSAAGHHDSAAGRPAAGAGHRAGDAESSSGGRRFADSGARAGGAGLSGVFARFLAGAQGHSSGAQGHTSSGHHAAPAAPAASAGAEDAPPAEDPLGNGPGAARRPESGRRKPGYVPINVTIKA
ncbi:hypothetical protein ACIP5Y_41805 [Nocardia sp. NPDC088792]|uniref:hypothetical protein n=1 Tax=Nocardia sp. NPDC088792 TaxID=3364332 RepID=UPI0037FEF928